MEKMLLLISVTIFLISCGPKNISEDIQKMEGIWIAEDYYNSFEKTLSAVESKNAFNCNYPVALRINSKEITNNILNIGYSVLHSHRIYSESPNVSVLKIDLTQKESIGYKTNIPNFNDLGSSYITWNLHKNSLTLYTTRGNKHEKVIIKYKRITFGFNDHYLYPNPLYHYTRGKTLKGKYILKDNKGITLSDNFEIKENGIATGFQDFENFTFYFSTDIYCGLPVRSDLILVCEDVQNNESQTFVFLIDRDKKGNISLHKRQMSTIDEAFVLGEKIYELVKKK